MFFSFEKVCISFYVKLSYSLNLSYTFSILPSLSEIFPINFLFNGLKLYSQLKLHLAGHSGSRLQSQHFGRPSWADHKVRRLRPSWSTWWNPISIKTQKISWAWRRAHIVPATQEAEAGESLEPRRQRLQWAKIVPLHSSLVMEQNSISKKLKNKIIQVLGSSKDNVVQIQKMVTAVIIITYCYHHYNHYCLGQPMSFVYINLWLWLWVTTKFISQ